MASIAVLRFSMFSTHYFPQVPSCIQAVDPPASAWPISSSQGLASVVVGAGVLIPRPGTLTELLVRRERAEGRHTVGEKVNNTHQTNLGRSSRTCRNCAPFFSHKKILNQK